MYCFAQHLCTMNIQLVGVFVAIIILGYYSVFFLPPGSQGPETFSAACSGGHFCALGVAAWSLRYNAFPRTDCHLQGSEVNHLCPVDWDDAGESPFLFVSPFRVAAALNSLWTLVRQIQPAPFSIILSPRFPVPPAFQSEMLMCGVGELPQFRLSLVAIFLSIISALLSFQPAEATGEVCLKYTLQSKNFENKVTFSLQPKFDAK